MRDLETILISQLPQLLQLIQWFNLIHGKTSFKLMTAQLVQAVDMIVDVPLAAQLDVETA